MTVAVAAVVFDLDGTLVDSRPDIATAVNRLRAGLALPPLDLEAVGGLMGEGSLTLVRRALADAPAAVRAAANADIDRLHARYLEHYAAVCTVATRPYDGVEELLAGCARRWPMALLTNKPIAMTRALVDHLGWGTLFRALVGGDSLPYRKPDGHTLLDVAAGLGVAPAAVVLVGDTRIDAETANAAGAAFVWAEWGYAAADDRRGLASGLSARTPAALANWLGALPQ
jgi:phosphoglycolate phosphatase